jgi:hypothetical protein
MKLGPLCFEFPHQKKKRKKEKACIESPLTTVQVESETVDSPLSTPNTKDVSRCGLAIYIKKDLLPRGQNPLSYYTL